MAASGPRNARYNGGLSFDKAARRWKIMCRDGSQMWYYRGVMAAHLGRLLTPSEIVHHVNEDTTDDRIENLEVTTRAAHIATHRDVVNGSPVRLPNLRVAAARRRAA